MQSNPISGGLAGRGYPTKENWNLIVTILVIEFRGSDKAGAPALLSAKKTFKGPRAEKRHLA